MQKRCNDFIATIDHLKKVTSGFSKRVFYERLQENLQDLTYSAQPRLE